MLTEYIKVAMQSATYKALEDNEGIFGEIPEFQGRWANAPTLEVCRSKLKDNLEEWILLGLRLGHSLPNVEGITINKPRFLQ